MDPARPPLNRLVLSAGSVADDVGFVALRDLGSVMAGDRYRIIGGHMVMMLVARWALGPDLYRQTQDTDLGVPPTAVANPVIIDRLTALGYERRAGNRFARSMSDIPFRLIGADAPIPEAVVDILVPSYTSRIRQNLRFGDHLVTTEVPGLASALQNPAIEMSLELHRLNGDLLDVEVSVADEVSALVLKAHATTSDRRRRTSSTSGGASRCALLLAPTRRSSVGPSAWLLWPACESSSAVAPAPA